MEDLEKYAAGKSLCGWTVKDPQKYDTPSPLAEFGLERPPMSWQYIEIPDAAEVG
jgi:predicted transcriptional regulator